MIVEDALAEGLADGGRGVADLELFVNVADVSVHGAAANVELVRDFLLHETLGEELENLKFPLGEGGFFFGFWKAVSENRFFEDELIEPNTVEHFVVAWTRVGEGHCCGSSFTNNTVVQVKSEIGEVG